MLTTRHQSFEAIVLFSIFPDEQRPGHMHVQRAHDPELRNLHRLVQQRQQICRNALLLVTESKYPKVNNSIPERGGRKKEHFELP